MSKTAEYPAEIAVDIFDTEEGVHFAVYRDDQVQGAMTNVEYDRGPVPEPLLSEYDSEDSWLYDIDAYRFLLQIWEHRYLTKGQ